MIFLSVFVSCLFCVASLESTSKLSVSKCKNCTEDVLYYAHGKCVPDVTELMKLTENFYPKSVSWDIAKNMSNACKKLLTCLEPNIECCETLVRLEIFERKCDKLNIKNYEMLECMANFYTVVNEGENDCSKDFEFLEKDLTKKRKAFKDGKSCFQEIITKNCSEKSNFYIQNYYDKFLNILTIPPKKSDSDSTHKQLVETQCAPLKNKLDQYQNSFEFSGNITEVCIKLEDCLQYIDSWSDPQYFSEKCSHIRFFSKRNFKDCFKFVLGLNLSQYKCVKETAYLKYVSASKGEIIGFSNDKECLRTVMAGECDKGLQETFDKDWDDLTRMT